MTLTAVTNKMRRQTVARTMVGLHFVLVRCCHAGFSRCNHNIRPSRWALPPCSKRIIAPQPSTPLWCSVPFSSSSKSGLDGKQPEAAEQEEEEEDESMYVKSYGIAGVGRRNTARIETNTGHTLETDVPKSMGGSDGAPQPVETLLAAWIGCTQATAVYVGRHMKPQRLILDRLEFHNIQAHRDERGALSLPIHETPSIPSRLQSITGTIKVYTKGNPPTKEQLQILSHQTELRCPVANMMIASGCQMDILWTDGATES